MSDELPATWASVPLGDLGKWGSGGTPSRKDPRNYGGAIPWLKIGDLPDGPISEAEEFITDKGLAGSSAKLLDPDTLLVAMYGSIGKLGITTMRCTTNQAIAFCKPHTGVDLHYLFYQLMGDRHRLVDQGQGGTQLNISQTILKSHEVPVAPSSEQKRIVSKLDELFSRINEGERALEQVSKLVERYRQSVLKAAVTGELTRHWREARKVAGQSIESGETLLTRILTARREAWEADELAKMKAKRITPKGDAWKKKYEDPMPPDTTGLPDLPEGWVWASLSQLSRSSSYGTSSKCSYEKTGIAVLRIPNIRSGRLDFSDIKYAAPDLDIADNSLLSYGDLLVVRTNGSASLIGVGCVVTDSTPMPCYFASYLIRFRLALPTELSAWVNLCWQSHVVRAFVDRHKATSAGQYNVSQSSLMGLCLPLGPANEMRSAADEVERLMSDAGAVSDSAISELRASSALRQSILKAAFGGRLVPQDQRDEPASTLLERIAVECGANNVAQKGGRRKKSA